PSAVWPNGVAITPALAMTTSKGSAFANSSSAQARTLLRSARSSAISSKLPPLAAASLCICAVAASALDKSRAAPTTCAPCAARERAVSTPSPAETPVTRIRLPCRFTPDKTSSVVEVALNSLAILSSSKLFLSGRLRHCKSKRILTSSYQRNGSHANSVDDHEDVRACRAHPTP